MDLLPQNVLEAIEHTEKVTEDYDKFVFTVCLAYGSREEIIEAVRAIAAEHAKGTLELDAIDEKEISNRLWTGDMPDPDLVIRTSGEERISNFLLWQSAYAEYYFTDVYWPSFSKADLLEAIEAYQTESGDSESEALEYRNPALAVDAAVRRADQVLLIQRGNEPWKGLGHCPVDSSTMEKTPRMLSSENCKKKPD